MRSDYHVPMVLKTLRILETLVNQGSKLPLSGIAHESRVAKASTFRILETLHSVGYVEKDQASGRYRLGLKILELGHTVERNSELRSLSTPFLLALQQRFNESTNLAVLENGEVLYLATVESSSLLRIARSEQSRNSLHCTALGKALAAFTPWETVQGILRVKGLPRMTRDTITNRADFKRELQKIRKKGFACDDEELEIGSWCAAAPVFDYTAAAVCAISISAPLSRAHGREREICSAVATVAAQFSAKLGYQEGKPRRVHSGTKNNARERGRKADSSQ
jgi:IclR family transcriptional regulator, KDG regulon repressor